MNNIKLGGKEWEIPKLAVKQNRVIVPVLIKIVPLFNKWAKEKEAAFPEISEHYNEILDVIFTALGRKYPELTRDEFESMEISFTDAINAYIVICEQSGIFAKAGATGEATQNP